MNIACVLATGKPDIDLLLSRLALDLESRGVRVCGTVQANTQRAQDCRCDVDLRVLPGGPVIRISQDLGIAARGCRLDASALETTVGIVEARLARGADILIVNRFGKREAEGRGFRSAIAGALSDGIPVLVGLSQPNRAAFEAFTGGLAQHLPADIAAIEGWALARFDIHAHRV